jgi:hypothetical protein
MSKTDYFYSRDNYQNKDLWVRLEEQWDLDDQVKKKIAEWFNGYSSNLSVIGDPIEKAKEAADDVRNLRRYQGKPLTYMNQAIIPNKSSDNVIDDFMNALNQLKNPEELDKYMKNMDIDKTKVILHYYAIAPKKIQDEIKQTLLTLPEEDLYQFIITANQEIQDKVKEFRSMTDEEKKNISIEEIENYNKIEQLIRLLLQRDVTEEEEIEQQKLLQDQFQKLKQLLSEHSEKSSFTPEHSEKSSFTPEHSEEELTGSELLDQRIIDFVKGLNGKPQLTKGKLSPVTLDIFNGTETEGYQGNLNFNRKIPIHIYEPGDLKDDNGHILYNPTDGVLITLLSNSVKEIQDLVKDPNDILFAAQFIKDVGALNGHKNTGKVKFINDILKASNAIGQGLKKPRIDHDKLLNRLEVIIAEREAGNNSNLMLSEGHKIINDLAYHKLLTRNEVNKLKQLL